jgi:hypothetical protein
LTGCASTPIKVSSVGPDVTEHAGQDSNGYLKVFSATEKSPPIASDDPTYFNLHSGYDINDGSGKSVKFVPNHDSNLDTDPDKVSLPAGNYNILARSTWCGQVIVPIVILGGKTTIVHLDNNWWPPSNTPTNLVVSLPNGEPVGWSSSVSKSPE